MTTDMGVLAKNMTKMIQPCLSMFMLGMDSVRERLCLTTAN